MTLQEVSSSRLKKNIITTESKPSSSIDLQKHIIRPLEYYLEELEKGYLKLQLNPKNENFEFYKRKLNEFLSLLPHLQNGLFLLGLTQEYKEQTSSTLTRLESYLLKLRDSDLSYSRWINNTKLQAFIELEMKKVSEDVKNLLKLLKHYRLVSNTPGSHLSQ